MMNFVLRARKLDWEQIKFKEFSAEECKKYWEYIQVNKFIDDDVFMIRMENSWMLLFLNSNKYTFRQESEDSGSWPK